MSSLNRQRRGSSAYVFGGVPVNAARIGVDRFMTTRYTSVTSKPGQGQIASRASPDPARGETGQLILHMRDGPGARPSTALTRVLCGGPELHVDSMPRCRQHD